MTHTFSSPVVVCRPALPSDKADMLEFTKFTWDGDDYIKHIWEHWFADPNGGLVVAEYAGHAVGMGKLTRLSPGNWWLQGLRVDPQYQDKGIGSHVNDYLVRHWLEHGEGVIRFLTSSDRVKVHTMAERNGFICTCERGKFSLPTLNEPLERQPFSRLSERDIPEAVRFAMQSESASLSLGLVDLGWKYAEISVDVFKNIYEDDECFSYWWQGRKGLILGWVDETRGEVKEQYLALSLVACKISDMDELIVDLRKLGAQNGQASIKWYAFLHPDLQMILDHVEFERDNENVNYLFEKRHPKRP